MGLLITFILGLFIIIGCLIVKYVNKKELVEKLSISIALGTMSTLIVLELIPEMLEHLEKTNIGFIIIYILLGIAILKLLDLFVPEHDHEHSTHHHCTEENVIHIGIISLIAIVLHNVIEGMAVYSIAEESIKTSILIGLGVGLHNIPMGMVISSTLKNEPRNKRLLAIILASISTFIGGIIMYLISSLITETLIGILISIRLGIILYIVLFELIPHIIHEEDKKTSIIGIIIGIIIIIISTMFE